MQLSLALTPPNTSGTAARQLVPALALLGAGQLTVGAVSSVTVKLVVQVALLVAEIGRASCRESTPSPTSVPAAGDCLKVIALVPLQLSLAVTVITCTPNPTSVPAAGDWLTVFPVVRL